MNWFAAGLLLLNMATLSAAPRTPLAQRYSKWLNQDVLYIITDAERMAFLGLAADTQRDQFIENFWEIRNPASGSATNPYKDEHYQRIEYANSHFGRESNTPGWMTDMGRTWILFGKPNSQHAFTGYSQIYPLELWTLRSSSHIISIAEEFRPYVLSSGVSAGRISVIPNWAPLDRIPLRPKDNAWSRASGLLGKRVLLYTGNLGMKHNPAILLKLCEASAGQSDAVVAVVAEGVGASWLAMKAKERRINNLHLSPLVSSDQLPDVLGTADVCLALLEPHASAYSVPSKIWTYFCSGKPLVLSIPLDNQGALIVQRVGSGVSSDPANECKFVSNCLEVLAMSSEKRSEIGAKGRAFAEANFGMESIVQRVSQCVDLALQS